MNTQGVKYIGSKSSLVPYIIQVIEKHIPSAKTALDVFTGTTRVAQALRTKGLHVTTSDLSWASEAYSGAYIESPQTNANLQEKINQLNALPAKEDWLTKYYCDAKGEENSIIRVWQPKNGKRADAIRNTIEEWHYNGELYDWEYKTLITSLILALDRVDNTVGVQQAYLKDWCNRSNNNLTLELPTIPSGPKGRHIRGDCLQINYPSADIAYLDPPYSSHSYATYYHIWDSITRWDKPEVGLKTNRRLDRVSGSESYDASMSSQWNSKKTALGAFDQLIQRLPVKYVLISYNDESIVSIEDLQKLFKKYPKVIIEEIDYKRNIMCQIGNAAKDSSTEKEFKTMNKEYIFLIQKS
jgi:adenine-specific DNA-methyltransferase